MTGRKEKTAVRAGMTRVGGLLLIVVSLVLAAGCALVFADRLPADVARYEAYRATERCAAGSEPDAWREDCLREVEFGVVGTVVERGGKTGKYRATVDSERFQGEVSFTGPRPLLDTLRPGDEVVGTVWRGDIVALAKDGVRQTTDEEPRDDPQMIAAIGAGLGLFAVLVLAFGAIRLVAPRRLGPFTWSESGQGLLYINTVVTLGVGLLAVWLGIPWQLVVPVIAMARLGVGFRLLGGHRSAWAGAR
ncbi:hypothetical protein ABZ990_06510 [Streptomyces sp. NPDC046203]|uniref:hypothetical protein n=1 Tax=Streptomyces sp. NPDC046203 TaxID=3154602 RepID=UPI00340C38A9